MDVKEVQRHNEDAHNISGAKDVPHTTVVLTHIQSFS